MTKSTNKENKNLFPPVVSVLGHVDHGKTTLLDSIRKTNIAEREHGGITQRIGASSIEILHEGKKRRITFIDTPGHETFSKMRSRGAIASDIGLLIISSKDGIKPQTKESINLLKDAKIPFIVVLTKADLEGGNPEKIKQQLLKEEVVLEGFGGDTPVIEVSAKTGKNIKELLELILLVYEVHAKLDSKLSENGKFEGIVIESKLDQKSGPKATIVIKNGKVTIREELVCEDVKAKMKTIINDKGDHLESATIGDAVEILGFEKVPNVGAVVYKKSDVSLKVKEQISPVVVGTASGLEESTLSVILRADTQGSLEAIVNAIPEKIFVVSKKTGEISPADVLLAKSTGSIILGFNIKVGVDVLHFARTEKVLLKNYTIIYELLDELKEALEGKILSMQEEVFGKAKVLASFPYEKTKVLGVAVLEGRVARGDKVRIMRKDDIIGESFVSSVRQGKNSISKMEKGQEAGLILSPYIDFTIGDVLICHS
ncbi:MAG: GTP-binding protein [Candidatus Levybacteria bacterium]|nr:GTP-binding protein [Candidatus Levybacteria bacterium]